MYKGQSGQQASGKQGTHLDFLQPSLGQDLDRLQSPDSLQDGS